MSGFRFRYDMTKDEAVDLLQKVQATPEHLEVNTADLHDALGMAIEALLTKRPHGKAIIRTNGDMSNYYIYSECHKPIDGWDMFCKNCGADMRGGAE